MMEVPCSALQIHTLHPDPLWRSNYAYFVNARITLAEMWRKKIEPMNERDRTRTINGSL